VKLVYLDGIGYVPPHFIDIRGETFGKLKVLSLDSIKTIKSGRNVYNYNCECFCGKVVVLSVHGVKSKYSCGCVTEFDKLPMSKGERCHGLSRTKTYRIWTGMQSRCYNPNSAGYKRYGAIGITVCDRWRESEGFGFLNFLEDMGEKPEGKSLNRINGAKIYSKETCEWATLSVQAFDVKRPSNNTSGRTGVYWLKDRKIWRVIIHVDRKTINLGYYLKFEDAVKVRESAELKYYGFIKE
jgi:hypothetical protein